MNAALLEIAINDYPGQGNDLRGCLQDMEDRRELLDLMALNVRHRVRLSNQEATLQWIRSYFQQLAQRPEPALVINMSGHGTTVPDQSGDEGTNTKFDSAFVNYDFARAGFLLDDEVGRMLDSFPTNKLIFLSIDACHSAGAQRSFAIQAGQLTGWYRTPVRVRPRALPTQAITDEAIAKTLETRKRLRLARGREGRSLLGSWLDSRNGIRYNTEPVIFWAAAKQNQTADDAFIEGQYRGAASFYWGQALKELLVKAQRARKEKPTLAEINKLSNKLLREAGHDHQQQIEGRETMLKTSLSRLFV